MSSEARVKTLRLFARLSAIYGNGWNNQFRDNDYLEFAVQQWAEALKDVSEKVLNEAVMHCRKNHKFAPNIPEFWDLCRSFLRKDDFSKRRTLNPSKPEVAEKYLLQMKQYLTA